MTRLACFYATVAALSLFIEQATDKDEDGSKDEYVPFAVKQEKQEYVSAPFAFK
jgi:hypothetical protein